MRLVMRLAELKLAWPNDSRLIQIAPRGLAYVKVGKAVGTNAATLSLFRLVTQTLSEVSRAMAPVAGEVPPSTLPI